MKINTKFAGLFAGVGIAVTASAVTPAAAVDLGYGFAVETEVVGTYNFNTEGTSLDVTVGLGYDREGFNAYVNTSFDLLDVDYTGVALGVNYNFDENFVVGVSSTVDVDGDFGDVLATVTFSF